MGIFGAMTTAISGLRAQSFALEQISGNIANSQTVGFKRNETSFVNLVADAAPLRQTSGGVDAFTRATNTVQGDVVNSTVGTHLSISGDGYFIVENATGSADGNPLFSGVSNYTRRGDFELDRNGYLVNGSGYYLKGLTLDPTTGNVNGSLPSVIQISNDFIPSRATTTIDYRANLASYPLTASADSGVANSELLAGPWTNDPTTDNATPANRYVQYSDVSKFLDQTISGGATTVFDSAGAPVNVQLRWGKIDSAASGGTESWNLFYLQDSTTSTAADPVWRNVGTEYTFSTAGKMTAPTGNVTIRNLTVNGVSIGDVTLNNGAAGVTQFADPNGVARVTDIDQNGFAAGELVGVSMGENGRIIASYTNGESIGLAQVPLASFNGDNALAKLNGGAFAETQQSGAAILGAQGSIVGQSLEGSNTDIADEFTKLIVTQQAYAAGTRIVSSSDEMLKEALNMLR